MVQNGRVSWDTEFNDGPRSSSDDFYKMKEGNQSFHLLELQPFGFAQHWGTNAEGKPISVRCPGTDACTLCKEAKAIIAANPTDKATKEIYKKLKAKSAFAIKAFSVELGKAVILQFGVLVKEELGKQIKTVLNINPEANLTNYVFKINFDKSRGKVDVKKTYIVEVTGTRKFTPADDEVIKEFEDRKIDLGKIFSMPTDEANLRKLGRVKTEPVAGEAPAVEPEFDF